MMMSVREFIAKSTRGILVADICYNAALQFRKMAFAFCEIFAAPILWRLGAAYR